MRFLPIVVVVSLLGCTQNERAKSFGGTMHINLPCGEKLTEITWKGMDLWYASRPMRADESPETTTFREDSPFGVIEGKVIVKECQ